MKKGWQVAVIGVLSSLAVTMLPKPSLAHDDDARVSVEKEQEIDVQAGNVSVEFQLIDLKNKVVLEGKDLALLHEKKLHVFFFDPALKEFRHEHAEFAKGQWQVATNLSVNGNYFVWVQGKIASDSEEFSANTRLKIVGGTAANPTPPVLGDVRTGEDGTSKVTLSNERIIAKSMMMLSLSVSRTDGSTPNLSPYLGEMAHVVGILEDGDTLIHVHPMETGNPTELMLHATFPAPGQYRLWVQFVDAGVLRTIPLSVTADAQ